MLRRCSYIRFIFNTLILILFSKYNRHHYLIIIYLSVTCRYTEELKSRELSSVISECVSSSVGMNIPIAESESKTTPLLIRNKNYKIIQPASRYYTQVYWELGQRGPIIT